MGCGGRCAATRQAIAIDEIFLNIEGKKVYIIITTGYTSRKVLGIKVSCSRKTHEMREVFDEAEHDTKYQIATVISDAWDSTISMVRHPGRPINHVIHKHKKPYDKAVIKRYVYINGERKIITIGVKTNVMKKHAKCQGNYLITTESLIPPPSKKQGRPNGSKSKKKVTHAKAKKKCGQKGLFKVFEKGKKFFFVVDPYRKMVKVSKNLPASVEAALAEVLPMFTRKIIQYNIYKNLNSILRSLLSLCGPKTIKSIERRIRI